MQGKPLPKFGEWDVNNPASAEGFTVIFSKASDEKKTKKASGSAGPSTLVSPQNTDQNNHQDSQNPKAKVVLLFLLITFNFLLLSPNCLPDDLCSLSRRNGFAFEDYGAEEVSREISNKWNKMSSEFTNHILHLGLLLLLLSSADIILVHYTFCFFFFPQWI